MPAHESRVSKQALAAALGAALLASGCITLPGDRPEHGALPQAWRDAPQVAAENGQDRLINWWSGFNDPLLSGLVSEGLANGPTIQLAAARVREARALSRTTITRYLPQLTATASDQYVDVIDGAGSPAGLSGSSYGAEASWEVPLFTLAPAALGARANTRLALADQRGAQVALAADIARAYVDLRAAQNSLRALQESVSNADRIASILDVSARAGFAAAADAADARRQAETTRARLAGFVIEQRRAEGVLATLRGHAPGTEPPHIMQQLNTAAPAPSLPITSAPAAPADLVRLRPDVASAEQNALLAVANLGGARADLLPRLNITGSISVTDAATIATGGPAISLPLFDWGERWATVRQRDAQMDQRFIEYRQTVNAAVDEATNALVSLDQGAKRLTAARIAEEAAETTLRGRRAAYEAGLLSLTDLLQAEQQTIDARLTRIDSEAEQARAGIAVYRAFGGGPPAVTN